MITRRVLHMWREWLSLTTLVVVVSTLTAAEQRHLIPLSALAASPHAVTQARVWSLLTSALLVQSPVFWSLISFALLGGLTLAVCGGLVLWVSAFAGHVGSTLVVYGLLEFARTLDPHSFESLLQAPDYGVSVISATWLGAVASVSWSARGRTLRGKMATALMVVATALFGWMLRRQVNALDLEYVLAFGVGVAVAVWVPRLAYATGIAPEEVPF